VGVDLEQHAQNRDFQISKANFEKKVGEIEIFCPAGEKVRKNQDFKKGSFSRFRGSYGEKTHFLSFSRSKFPIFFGNRFLGMLFQITTPLFLPFLARFWVEITMQ